MSTAIQPAHATKSPRHTALVRVTHWITFIAFVALTITGAEIIISHPRFYWGETGNVNTPALFQIPIASSRDTVPTGFAYVMPDQNGWSRALHFEAAWLLVLSGAVYGIAGLLTGHFRKNFLPEHGQWTLRAYRLALLHPVRRGPRNPADEASYNVLQRTSYLAVVFVLFPLVIWTGLAMSPGFTAAVPLSVSLLGGRQSARTLHFFVSDALVLFLFVHVAMVALSGFPSRMRSMITGHPSPLNGRELEGRERDRP